MTKWVGVVEGIFFCVVVEWCGRSVVHRYEKDERYKAVAEAEKEVGGYGGDIAVDYELDELEWWMRRGRIGKDEEHMCW